MIDSSESFLKQCYGQDVMARLLIQRNLDFDGILLIRDCGFQIEVDPLEEWFGVENLYMVNLFREGCDFTNDYREYVHTNGKMHQDIGRAHVCTQVTNAHLACLLLLEKNNHNKHKTTINQ